MPTWTNNIDEDLKPNIALSNFSQNVPWSVMFDLFIFTKFSRRDVFFHRELFETFFHGSFVNFVMPCFLKLKYFQHMLNESFLEYKTMNVERQRPIFVEPQSDSIHIPLQRNDGFLHSFHDFWKSNVFSENLIRMKFFLHKIFFRMSILSSCKIWWMFFNLH